MESIHVIIAEMSQLVRLGISGILRRMGYPFVIKEITEAEKLPYILDRGHKFLFIISSSFVGNCSAELFRKIMTRSKKCSRILIRDTNATLIPDGEFDTVIEPEDNEKTIIRKFDKHFKLLLKTEIPDLQTGEISDREREVLQLVALGMTNKEIAEKLFISSHTVITHRKNITAKLGIKTIAGLTVYAVIHKLIEPKELQ